MGKIFAFIFQLSAWALVASSCFVLMYEDQYFKVAGESVHFQRFISVENRLTLSYGMFKPHVKIAKSTHKVTQLPKKSTLCALQANRAISVRLRASLVPRPYACVRERVWLHKSKSLGSLQNLKASNEIAKWCLLQ